jgi:hypothetical protein
MAALIATLAVSQTASAALVTLTGTNFDVQFDNTQLSLGVFGTPSLTSGNIVFSGNNFFAQSTNGQGTTTNGADFVLFLVPHQNTQVTGLSLFAFGDYRLQGDNSYVKVSGSLAADDAGSSDPARSTIRALNVTSPSTVNGEIQTPQNNQNSNWQAYAGVMSGSSPWLETTGSVRITISSLLTAYTDPNDPNPSPGFAFIQEKLFVQQPAVTLTVSSDPMVVPLPATLPLLAGGISTLCWFGRRARRARDGFATGSFA